MALQPCLTCQAMISTSARRCPQCGEPSPHATNRQKWIGIVVVLLFAAGAFAFVMEREVAHEEEMREFRHQHGFPNP